MIDTTIRFNDHNSFKVTSVLLGYPFGVEQMDYITHSFQAYSTSMLASATRARTKFFDADGATISDVSHAFAVTTVFGKVEITVAVPATATQAQLMLIQGGTDWWIAEPKSEQGQVATPYNVNYAGQLTYITPNGIYTGMMTTGQIVVTGSVGDPSETLDTRLVTINNGVINLTATVGSLAGDVSDHETRVTTIEAGQITLTSRVGAVEPKVTKITSAGVYTGEVVATQITSGYISADRISAKSITGAKMADGTVGTLQIAASAITADKIAAGTITGNKIAASAITADKINATDLVVFKLSNLNNLSYYMTYGYSGSPGFECFMPTYGKWFGISPTSTGNVIFYDKGGMHRLLMDSSATYLNSQDGYQSIGADNSGPYYRKNGVKTYF